MPYDALLVALDELEQAESDLKLAIYHYNERLAAAASELDANEPPGDVADAEDCPDLDWSDLRFTATHGVVDDIEFIFDVDDCRQLIESTTTDA